MKRRSFLKGTLSQSSGYTAVSSKKLGIELSISYLNGQKTMNEKQNALKIFEEELGELAMEILSLQQQVSKAIRFGLDEQRDLPTSNRERIESEWNDLLGSLKNLSNLGIELTPNIEMIEKKVSKIEKYTKYSKDLGEVDSL